MGAELGITEKKLTKLIFRLSFTELIFTSHHLQLEVVPNPDKNGEFFEAHLHGGETAAHLMLLTGL